MKSEDQDMALFLFDAVMQLAETWLGSMVLELYSSSPEMPRSGVFDAGFDRGHWIEAHWHSRRG